MAAECQAQGIYVQRSTIKHKDAGFGLFAGNDFGSGEVICYYCGSLVYSNLSGKQQHHRTYGEGIMGVTVKEFETWAIQMDHPCRSLEGDGRAVWVVPATFWAVRYINDPRYLSGDREPSHSRQNTPIQANTMFSMTSTPTTVQLFTDFTLISIVAKKNIRRNEESFRSYGPDYIFNRDDVMLH